MTNETEIKKHLPIKSGYSEWLCTTLSLKTHNDVIELLPG
jgi:hypothetical protein